MFICLWHQSVSHLLGCHWNRAKCLLIGECDLKFECLKHRWPGPYGQFGNHSEIVHNSSAWPEEGDYYSETYGVTRWSVSYGDKITDTGLCVKICSQRLGEGPLLWCAAPLLITIPLPEGTQTCPPFWEEVHLLHQWHLLMHWRNRERERTTYWAPMSGICTMWVFSPGE